jgi:hypothetical protein
LELLFIAEESGIHYKVGVSGQTDITKRKKRCTQFSNKFERGNMFCQVFLESLNQLCECLGVWMCVSVSFLLNVFYVFSLFSLVLDVRYRIDKFVKTFLPFFFHLTYLNSIKVITKFYFPLFLERLQKLINYLRELYLHIINVC